MKEIYCCTSCLWNQNLNIKQRYYFCCDEYRCEILIADQSRSNIHSWGQFITYNSKTFLQNFRSWSISRCVLINQIHTCHDWEGILFLREVHGCKHQTSKAAKMFDHQKCTVPPSQLKHNLIFVSLTTLLQTGLFGVTEIDPKNSSHTKLSLATLFALELTFCMQDNTSYTC